VSVRGQTVVVVFANVVMGLPGGRRRVDVNRGIRQDRQSVQELVTYLDCDLVAALDGQVRGHRHVQLGVETVSDPAHAGRARSLDVRLTSCRRDSGSGTTMWMVSTSCPPLARRMRRGPRVHTLRKSTERVTGGTSACAIVPHSLGISLTSMLNVVHP
jgi:hypothetical protein